jgi:transcriptional regulator GlxA family with amidase domain
MSPLQFGVLMTPYQALDAVGPLDILSSASKELIGSAETGGVPGSKGLTEKAIDIQFHHINVTMDPVLLTAGFKVLPSVTCDDCPPLDCLLIGGADPFNYKISDRFAEFVRAHLAAGKVLFTTCTGAMAIAPRGLLDGKKATTNHMALPFAEKESPNVQWSKEQWVVDGNIWSAGGACAGMDMMAHWVIENYGIEVAACAFKALDFEPRDREGKSNIVLPKQHA